MDEMEGSVPEGRCWGQEQVGRGPDWGRGEEMVHSWADPGAALVPWCLSVRGPLSLGQPEHFLAFPIPPSREKPTLCS